MIDTNVKSTLQSNTYSEIKSTAQLRGCAKKISKKKEATTTTITQSTQFDEPLTIDIPDVEIKKAQIDWEAFDRLKQFNDDDIDKMQFNGSSSSAGSTDSLIEEANDFLAVAKEKLVTTADWNKIKAKKKK